ncbi:MAG: hypothetical protein ACR2P0_04920 [Acidimicrobiales bacterium]
MAENSSMPDDLVVVAAPDDGISGASLRVSQQYWPTVHSTAMLIPACALPGSTRS